MANLNLSEFTEKLFVADADHTFIWDTANAISKRVSRNSWLNSGELTSSAPVTISQTWNNAAVAFTGVKVNAVNTASAAASLLLDLQVGGVSQFNVNKLGNISFTGRYSAASIAAQTANSFAAIKSNYGGGGGAWMFGGQDVGSTVALAGDYIGFNGIRVIDTSTSDNIDTRLYRDGAANTLALRNGAAAQTFNVYGTSSSNNTVYERMFMRYTAASTLAFQIGTEQVGATARPLQFSISGSKRLIFEATGVNDTQIYAAGNTGRNILTLRSLDESGRYQFYINGAGKSELYVGTGALISEAGSSYFNGGNVGIGTTAPSTLLEVALPSTGNTLYQGIKVSRGTGYFSLGNGTGTTPNNFVGLFVGKGGISGTAAALGFQAIAGSDSDTSTSVAFFNVRNTTDNGNILDSQIAYQFRNYLTNLITVLGSGNVGIGTTAPTAPLHVQGTAIAGRENLFKASVSDDAISAFHIFNGTSATGKFVPSFSGSNFDSTLFASMSFVGQTDATNDTGSNPLVLFQARRTDSTSDPNNGNLSSITTRPLFSWRNLTTDCMLLAANGNLGIGTTSPTTKLHVAETWNNAGTAFCAIKSVITDTNSAAGSDFLELYSGTSTQPLRMDINKTGQINIYGTWTDASNYERLSFSAPTAGNAIIGTNRSGGTARGLEFQTDGVTRMAIDSAGETFIGVGFTGLRVSVNAVGGSGSVANIGGGGAQTVTGRSGGSYGWTNDANSALHSLRDTALFRNAAGVVEINNGTAGAFRDLRVRSVIQQPPATITPDTNGDLVVEATSNTTLTFKLKGTDGTVRTGTITLA